MKRRKDIEVDRRLEIKMGLNYLIVYLVDI